MEDIARDYAAQFGGDFQSLIVPVVGAAVLLVVAKALFKGALKGVAIGLIVSALLVVGLAAAAVGVARSSCRTLETKDPRAYAAARCDQILGR